MAAMDGCVGLMHVASPVQLPGDGALSDEQAVSGTERALRFAAASGSVQRVVVTATMASVCGTQRDKDPDHLWCEADKNDNPETGYSKSKTAAEAKVWELAEAHKEKFSVTTVHPAVVLGPVLEGQSVSSTMGYLKMMLSGKVIPLAFGLCSAADVAAVHLAGIEKAETAGERYLVCSTDQYSTLELVELAREAAPEACAGLDLAAWKADEKVAALKPKKPATDNRKACALLGVERLEAPLKFVGEAAASLKALGLPSRLTASRYPILDSGGVWETYFTGLSCLGVQLHIDISTGGLPPPLPREDTRLAPLPLAIITDGKEVRVAHAGLGSCAASQGPLLAASCSIASLSPCSARPVWIASYTSRVAAALPHSTCGQARGCVCVCARV